MASTIVPDPVTDGNRDERRTLARLLVYFRAELLGRGATRAYLIALVAWRLGDTPPSLPPAPADFGLTDAQGAAWSATVDSWLAEALARIEGDHA